MADITAKAVMELRNRTGVSMMECKKALVEANGDQAEAVDILRKKGAAKADKKSDRETSEGAVAVSGRAVVSIRCETDFVARNEDFLAFVNELAEKAEADGAEAATALFETEKTEKITQMGENLTFGECAVIAEGDTIGSYIHSNNKIASLVALKGGTEDLARDIAMHVVGMKPVVIDSTDLDISTVEAETESRIAAVKEENIDREKLGKPLKNIPQFISRIQISDEILSEIEEKIKEELKAEGKPEKIWDKIIPGKIERFIDDNTSYDLENVLLCQSFAKDPSKKVSQLLKENGAEIESFLRIDV